MSKYIVRYGAMRSLGVMGVRGEEPYRRGMEVIVRTNRGLEVGQVLCEATDDALSHLDEPPSGQILREVSSDDANEVAHIDSARRKNIEACQKYVDQLGLDMSLVDVEQLFGGERMVVFYLAEERVDFRELVKLLASEFQTRIEMKQIGVRDEAKLLADYGDCGKPVCCNNHLVTMPPVSMRMAKLQKATLDPTKISGRCGRLKCCLRYEFDNYDQIQKSLPRVGATVLTRNGKGRVLSQQLLVEQLLVEMEDHRRVVIDAGEVLSVIKTTNSGKSSDRDSHSKKKPDRKEVDSAERAESSTRGQRRDTKDFKKDDSSPETEVLMESPGSDEQKPSGKPAGDRRKRRPKDSKSERRPRRRRPKPSDGSKQKQDSQDSGKTPKGESGEVSAKDGQSDGKKNKRKSRNRRRGARRRKPKGDGQNPQSGPENST